VVGGMGDSCRKVAELYGFPKAVIPGDLLVASDGLVSPFSNINRHQAYARSFPSPNRQDNRIDAVFVFNDSRDWALDIQLIVDVLLSDQGRLGTRRRVQEVKRDGHVPVYFSNPDLWWANGYPFPRLGQGGFRAALEGVWREIMGGGDDRPLKAITIGKPHGATYSYAEEVLTEWRKSKQQATDDGEKLFPDLRTVYMVGDNPASDIKGANNYRSSRGTQWISILLRTGVYRDGDNDCGASVIVDNVEEAVRWAVLQENAKPRKNTKI
jgi:HAD superfamily hydrolase (TIGR01456 family)